MTGWNLPPGCTARDIDEAAGAYDEPADEGPPEPTSGCRMAYVTRFHSFGLEWDDDAGGWYCYRVNYGPIDVTASSWIVPGTIHDEPEEGL